MHLNHELAEKINPIKIHRRAYFKINISILRNDSKVIEKNLQDFL